VGQRIAQEQNDCFAAFLTKPIKQSQLYNVLIDLFTGRDATERLAQETATNRVTTALWVVAFHCAFCWPKI
jgi:hypothetical protein